MCLRPSYLQCFLSVVGDGWCEKMMDTDFPKWFFFCVLYAILYTLWSKCGSSTSISQSVLWWHHVVPALACCRTLVCAAAPAPARLRPQRWRRRP